MEAICGDVSPTVPPRWRRADVRERKVDHGAKASRLWTRRGAWAGRDDLVSLLLGVSLRFCRQRGRFFVVSYA